MINIKTVWFVCLIILTLTIFDYLNFVFSLSYHIKTCITIFKKSITFDRHNKLLNNYHTHKSKIGKNNVIELSPNTNVFLIQ